ncbi:hypothetical protein FOZ62_007124, partial [Perkinsus olseni]
MLSKLLAATLLTHEIPRGSELSAAHTQTTRPAGRYFFWFFESRSHPETDPIFLWLGGGPGDSGIASAVGYNGPCLVNTKGTATATNPYSWTNRANGIWLDQPVGAGFSSGG